MIKEGLHCRLLALTYGDFDAVARTAQRFGKPITGQFEQTPSSVTWEEFLSFETGDWSWASGIKATKIKTRIAIVHLGTLYTDEHKIVGVTGILSGFSSLSSAGRNYILRAFSDSRVTLHANLDSIIYDPSLQAHLVGYSYQADDFIHTISRASAAAMPNKLVPAPARSDLIRSVTLQAATATVQVDESGDLLLSAEAGTAEYAIEDSKQVFGLIAQYLKTHR
jgi:hypothetical protein